MNEDYWTYTLWRPGCYAIVGPNDDFLIGDQLPTTEEEARLLCRCANIARTQALAEAYVAMRAAMEGVIS